MAKVFVSATSDDLAPARALVKQGLLTINLEVVEQTDFEVDYATMLQRLRRKIERCDAMVHIAGFRYGGEPDPNALPPNTPRLSYTQWEYHLAKEIAAKRAKKGKRFPIYVLVTGVDFPAEPIPPNKIEDDSKRQLQLAHRALLNPEKNTIATIEQLEKRSREAQVELELSVSLVNVGQIKAEQGDTASALSAFQRSLEIGEALALADPSSAQAKGDVSVSLDNVGQIKAAQAMPPAPCLPINAAWRSVRRWRWPTPVVRMPSAICR